MDLYLRTGLTGTPQIIDDYESFVWTERFSGAGDFVLTVKEGSRFWGNLRSYKYMTCSMSQRIMMVETIEEPRPEEGEAIMTVKGRSIEAFLEHRHNKSFDTDEIVITGTTAYIVEYMVDRYCIQNTSPNAGIPSLYILPNSVGGTSSTVVVKRDTIYNIVQSLCDLDGLGWRIVFDKDRKLGFQVYDGIDRSDPTKSWYYEFSEDMENLKDVSSVRSVTNYKNHARVLGKRTATDVYAPGTSSSVSGLERRTLVVDAKDIGEDDTRPLSEDVNLLKKRGLEALAELKNQYVNMLDGDIVDLEWNLLGTLGDIVVVKSGIDRIPMRIAEVIWSADRTGVRRTPTFSIVE